jgi:hypothetical protein
MNKRCRFFFTAMALTTIPARQNNHAIANENNNLLDKKHVKVF